MTLRACIPSLIAEGKLDQRRAQGMLELLDELEPHYKRQFGDQAGAAMASRDAIERLEAEAFNRRRQAVLQMSVQKGIRANLARAQAEGATLAQAAVAHFDFDVRVKGISNLEARRRAILGQAHARLTDLLYTFRKNLLGNPRQPALLSDVVREAFGESTGSLSANELARAWRDTAEGLRKRFNAAGGAIGKREDWGLPQAHDSLKVREVDFATWRDFIAPRLDPAKMVDEMTGKPFTPQGLELALKNVYETIRSDGWVKRTPGSRGGSKLANRRADHRFLAFKSADDWLTYNERFGAADPFSAMMGHIDGMSRDIASLEILGPNPETTMRWLADLVEREAAVAPIAPPANAVERAADRFMLRGDPRDAARGARYQMETIWGLFSGQLNSPVNSRFARTMSGIRAWQTASKLGSAVLSAVTDLGFQQVTSRFVGLPYGGILTNYMKLLNPLDAGDRLFAARAGLIAEEWAGRAGELWRYGEDAMGQTAIRDGSRIRVGELTRRLSDGVLRASGLAAWTQAGKWAFGMEFMGHLADNAGRAFRDLDAGLRETLERYAIGADGWDVIRETALYEHGGTRFLRPDDVAARDDLANGLGDQLATKLLEMIQSEQRFAVPEASLRARAAMTGGARPGTAMGELWRSAMQFKAFPVTIIYTHLMRAMLAKGHMSRGAYTANLIIGTTILGALALQLKQVAAGKDPRPMDQPEFWGGAMAQGGGLGIFGDFLLADQNRFGGSLAETLAGPTVSTAADTLKLTVGNAQQLASGEDTDVGRELARYLQANTPGSSLWYSRVAFQRLMIDQLQAEVDPDHRASWRRMEAKARRDFDQGYWWRPGETAPERAPDIENAIGGEQ